MQKVTTKNCKRDSTMVTMPAWETMATIVTVAFAPTLLKTYNNGQPLSY